MSECVEDISFVYRIMVHIYKYMIYFLNHSFCITALTLLSDVAGTMDGYAQAGTGIQNIKATYAVEIVPEAHVGLNTKHVFSISSRTR
jgi:hypothetical protein